MNELKFGMMLINWTSVFKLFSSNILATDCQIAKFSENVQGLEKVISYLSH